MYHCLERKALLSTGLSVNLWSIWDSHYDPAAVLHRHQLAFVGGERAFAHPQGHQGEAERVEVALVRDVGVEAMHRAIIHLRRGVYDGACLVYGPPVVVGQRTWQRRSGS